MTAGTQPPSSSGRARRLIALRRFALDITPLRQSHDYRFLFGGQVVSVIGGQVRIVTVPYLVFLLTHSSLAVGLVSLAEFVPSLFFALAGGTLADTMDRRSLLRVTSTLLTLLSALLAVPLLLGHPPLWFIVVIVTAIAGAQAADNPARKAIIPRLVGREQFANAMAIDQLTYQVGGVLGPSLAGLLLARFGVGAALLFATFASIWSLGSLFFVAPMPPMSDGGTSARRGIQSVREGLAYLKDKPAILSTFIIDINAMVFGLPTALFPALATQVFKVGPAGLGLMYAAPGAGAFLGALLTGWVNRVRRQGRAVIVAVGLWGLAIVAFGLLTRFFWLALIVLAVAGAADMFSAIFRNTILQLAVPDRLRGRLSSVHFLVVTSGPRLGDLEAGAVATLAGTRFSVISGGAGALLGAIVVALMIPAFAHYDAQAVDVAD